MISRIATRIAPLARPAGNRRVWGACLAVFMAVGTVSVLAPSPVLAQQEGDPAPAEGESQAATEGEEDGQAGEEGALEAPRVDDIDDILRGEEAIFGAFEGYSYDPGERRDPFRSLLVTREQDEEEGPRPDGIPGLLIDEINLIGILKTPEGYLAQVQAADRGQSYLLREGEKLYDGLVLSIEENEVKFRQEVEDRTAVKPFRERVKVLNPS